MASFEAKYPYFCPVAEEPEGALPLYKGEPVRIGRLVKADLTGKSRVRETFRGRRSRGERGRIYKRFNRHGN